MPRLVGDSKTYRLEAFVRLVRGEGQDPVKVGTYCVDAPSVSTIAKVFDLKSDALTGWAFKSGVEGMMALVQAGVDISEWDYAQTYQAMKKAGHTPYVQRGRAAARGNEAHDVLERLAKGEDPGAVWLDIQKLRSEVRGYAEAVFDWWGTASPDTILAEVPVFGFEPKAFGGQLDFYGERGPREVADFDAGQIVTVHSRVLTDLKTSKDLYPETLIQLDGYHAGLVQSHPDLPAPQEHSVLLAREDGTWDEIFVPSLPEVWLAALEAYYSVGELGKALDKKGDK